MKFNEGLRRKKYNNRTKATNPRVQRRKLEAQVKMRQASWDTTETLRTRSMFEAKSRPHARSSSIVNIGFISTKLLGKSRGGEASQVADRCEGSLLRRAGKLKVYWYTSSW